MKVVFLVIAVIFLFFSSPLVADTIFIKDGSVVKGEIKSDDGNILIILNEEGRFILNKREINHIEKDDYIIKNKDVAGRITELLKKISANKFQYVRKKIKLIHIKIFNFLKGIPLYEKITSWKPIKNYMRNNYEAYVVAVYMIFIIISGLILKIIGAVFYSIYCKIFNVRENYDL